MIPSRSEKSEFFKALVEPVDEMTEHVFEAVAHFRDRDAVVLGVLDALVDFAGVDCIEQTREGLSGPHAALDWLVRKREEFVKESGWTR